MRIRFRALTRLVAGISLCYVASAAAAEPGMAKAQSLMAAGKAAEAYALLATTEFEMSGNPDYDYLLGIAALDSGKPDKATLAFERVLAVNPNHAGARLDMARAYFQLGDHARAKIEFETVLGQNPPAAAKTTVEKYLAAIEQQNVKASVTGYLEGSAGHDDNITAATSAFSSSVTQAFPGLPPTTTPTGNALKRKDGFIGMAGGAELNYRLEHHLTLYAGLDARQRDYNSEGLYNSESMDERFGAALTEGANSYRLGMQFQQYRQQGGVTGITNNRNSGGVNLEWKHALNDRNQITLFGLYSRQRYPDLVDAINGAHYSDLDQSMIGLNWLGLLAAKGNPVVFASLSYGEDDAQHSKASGTNIGKAYLGLRFYGQYSLDEHLDVFGMIGYQWRNDKSMFDRSATNSGVPYGKDELADTGIGLNWRPYPNWTLRPQVSYWRNSSNLSLYSYDRTETSVTVRYDFR